MKGGVNMEEKEEEFEEYDEPKEQERPREQPEERKRLGRPLKYPESTKQEESEYKKVRTKQEEPTDKPPIQYVGVPRAVSIETMINDIYDGQQEIKQALMTILEKLK